jgi:sulfur carrier protein ThiS
MFTMIKEPISARNLLKKMDLQRDLALICLNDDVVVRDEAVTQLLREWQSKRWGTKAQWEVLHI